MEAISFDIFRLDSGIFNAWTFYKTMMKRIIIWCFIGILFSAKIQAQFFYQHYDQFRGLIRSIHAFENGDFLLTGDYRGGSADQFPDVFCLRVDSLGDPLNEPIYWGTDSLESHFTALVFSNEKFATVRNVSSNNGQADFYQNTLFAIYDFDGNLINSALIEGKIYDFSKGNLLVLNDTTFAFVNTLDQDVQFTRFYANGEIQVQKVYATDSSEVAISMVSDSSGGFYISAELFEGPSDYLDLILLHIDFSGEVIWKKVLHGDYRNYHTKLLMDEAGNLYLVGHAQISSSITKDLQVIKCTPSGESLWWATLDQPDHDLVPLDAIYSDGAIYVTGRYGNPIIEGFGSDYSQVLIAKIDTAGSFDWQHQIKDNQVAVGYSGIAMCIHYIGQNELIIGGSYYDSSFEQPLLIKTNVQGEYDINQELGCIAITTYPNPFENSFIINIGPRDFSRIKFYDLSGNELRADFTLLNRLITVVPEQWPAGLIEVKLSFTNAPDFSIKLIRR
jgi:hypothetical protein